MNVMLENFLPMIFPYKNVSSVVHWKCFVKYTSYGHRKPGVFFSLPLL